jgi:hypothetical protein
LDSQCWSSRILVDITALIVKGFTSTLGVAVIVNLVVTGVILWSFVRPTDRPGGVQAALIGGARSATSMPGPSGGPGAWPFRRDRLAP